MTHTYPYLVDNRTFDEKLLEESEYYVKLLAKDQYKYRQQYDDAVNDEVKVEVDRLTMFNSVNKLTEDAKLVERILTSAGWKVEDGKVFYNVIKEQYDDESDQ